MNKRFEINLWDDIESQLNGITIKVYNYANTFPKIKVKGKAAKIVTTLTTFDKLKDIIKVAKGEYDEYYYKAALTALTATYQVSNWNEIDIGVYSKRWYLDTIITDKERKRINKMLKD